MNKTDIGKVIRERRLEKRITQQELANRSGINEPYISEIERGLRDPAWDTAIKILKALDLKIYGWSEDLKETGEEIRKKRLDLGWSQMELAMQAGYTDSAVSIIETGRRKHPCFYTVEDIIMALGERLTIREADG